MDPYILALTVIGLLLLVVTLGSGWIARLPLSYALIYLLVGVLLGPYGARLIDLRPDTEFLEHLTEMVVIVSLFSCGLKMSRPIHTWSWQSTIRLIGLLMPLSIIAIAGAGHWILGLSWGAAVLLGAILSPTDPVLASEVQLNHPDDQDELRFGLTSEGGLNDALAFPFVYFGLKAIENDQWLQWLGEWVLIDLLWAIGAGILMGVLVARGVIWVDQFLQKYRAADDLMEDFVALSTILLTYGLTEVINGYGFLAVFVGGIVTQRYYRRVNTEKQHSQLRFTERVEKLLEITTILLLGSLLRFAPIIQYGGRALILALLLLVLIRPVAAWLSTIKTQLHPSKRLLFGWFGIRGVGSLYYLFYALGEGLQDEAGETIAWTVFITVVLSVILHGTSATPLMRWYEQSIEERRKQRTKMMSS